MSNENAPTHDEISADLRAKYMPMMDDGFREIARAMCWTEVAVSGPTPYSDTVTVALLGPYSRRDPNNYERAHIATAVARMREQALDIARASVGNLRETIESARHNIRVASLGLDAIERDSR